MKQLLKIKLPKIKLPKIKKTKKKNNTIEVTTNKNNSQEAPEIYTFKNYTLDDKVILLAYERRLKLLENYKAIKKYTFFEGDHKIIITDYRGNKIGFNNQGLITGGKSGDQVYNVNTFSGNGENDYKLEKMILKIYRKKNKKHFREIYNQIMFHSYFLNNDFTPNIPCPKVYLQGKFSDNEYYLLMENVRDNIYSCELEEFIIKTSSTKIYNNSDSDNVCIKNLVNTDNIENIFLQLIDIIIHMIKSPQIVYNHCDIHPKNVIITFNDGKYQVKLIDFGEARNLIKKTKNTFKACDKGRFAAMSMNKVFSTKTTNLFKKKIQGKKSFFSILLREFISLFRKDNVGRVDLRFFYMNLYLYLLLSDNLYLVTDKDNNVLKELKNLINSFNPLNDNIINILNNIREKTQAIFSHIKPPEVINLNKGSSRSDSEYGDVKV